MERRNVSFRKSLIFKILSLMVTTAVVVVTSMLLVIMPETRKVIEGMVVDDMLSVGESFSVSIERMSRDKELVYDDYAELLAGEGLEGIESSYVYVVDKDGIVRYHPDKQKVGNKIENAALISVVNEIKKGKIPKPEVVSYNFKGDAKYACYHVLDNGVIVTVSVDRDEIMKPIEEIKKYGIVASVLALLVAIGVATCLSIRIAKPIIDLAGVVEQAANFNFSQNEVVDRLSNKKDETGVMAKAILELRTQMCTMLESLGEVRADIKQNVIELIEVTTEINARCTDNSATTEELAAGMEETSATSDVINSNVIGTQEDTIEIKDLATSGEQLSVDIRERANRLHEQTESAIIKIKEVYEDIKADIESAIEESKAVEKINSLTDVIMSIASQTNLLALNASIEAAHAGDAGKGFAVVAAEISSLAKQSSDAVDEINNTIVELKNAVNSIVDSLKKSMEFLEDTVLEDYQQFDKVSFQYRSDADVVNNSMTNIECSVKKLITAVSDIAKSLDGMNTTIAESAIGVNDIAEKTTDIVELTLRSQNVVAICENSVSELDKLMSRFKV